MGKLFQDNEVVLITGGSSGLGRVLVEMFIRNGARVAFTYRSESEKVKTILSSYPPDRIFALRANASDYIKAKEVVVEVLERFGQLDILVNNAASAVHKKFLALSVEDVEYTMNNTFFSVFNYSQACAEYFAAQFGGCIVQIGSINGERGREGSAPYCAAKAAVEGLSKTIAKELGCFGVRCNVVAPGYIATEGQESTSPLIQKLVLDECAIRKLTEPKEVGNLVLFLSSNKANNITGQVYRIDCGQYI